MWSASILQRNNLRTNFNFPVGPVKGIIQEMLRTQNLCITSSWSCVFGL